MIVTVDKNTESRRVWRAKAWDALNAPTVDVELRRKSILVQEPDLSVNWSCCGAVPLENAEAFAETMTEAVRVAAEMEKELKP